MAREETRGGLVVTELVRLGIVVVLTAAGFALGPTIADLVDADPERTSLLSSVLGALFGYLLGGATGRKVTRSVDVAQERLQRIDSAVLISSVMGATLAALLGVVLVLPLMFLPDAHGHGPGRARRHRHHRVGRRSAGSLPRR